MFDSVKLLFVFVGIVFVSSSMASKNERWVVSVVFQNETQINMLADQFDHFKLNSEKRTVDLEVDSIELEWLQNRQFEVLIHAEKTRKLNHNLSRNRAVTSDSEMGSGIAGFSCYRTVEETFASAENWVATYPDLASWNDEGDSWEKTQNSLTGYDLKVLVITNQANNFAKPPLFVSSGVHAREYANAELVTRFAEWLLTSYGNNADATWLIDHHEIHLMLQANPDGRKQAETGLSWRKNTNNNFCPNSNTRGIDLNRNFDFEWGCCGGSSTDHCSLSYRGPYATSEPETLAMQNYMDGLFTDYRNDDLVSVAPDTTEGIFLDIHSFGEVILSSWGFTSNVPPNGPGILSLARKFAFFNDYTPQLGSLGTVDGATKDYAYGRFGVPGYTIELGTAFFEDCAYFENSILDKNLAALIYAAKASRQPYTISKGPDIFQIQSQNGPVNSGQNVLLTAVADDQRYVNGPGAVEPTQLISQAQYSIDLPPWHANAVIVTMNAEDSIFDESQESIERMIDTTGLPLGKRIVFIRAQDSNGNWGATSAEYLEIIDPNLAPFISGTITDINTGNPILGAQVMVNNYALTTDASGVYSIQVSAGEYDLIVETDGYQSAELLNLSVTNSQTSQNDFSLVPLVEYFSHDGENGNNGWEVQPQSGWTLSEESANSPTHAWTDSEGGSYPDNADFSLTSPAIDLSQLAEAILTFNHQYEFESGYDYGHFEVSIDEGVNWIELMSYTGNSSVGDWLQSTFNLTPYVGTNEFRMRFRVSSDSSVVRDGWHIDDIAIVAPFIDAVDLIFEHGFEPSSP